MEEKFLEKLRELFPNISFKLVREEIEGLVFHEKEKETLLVNKTPIKLSWTPTLAKLSEEYFEHFWERCLPAVKRVIDEKKKSKSFKILEKFRSKYVSN
jgi:tRNA A22 N-methylase